MSAARHNPMLAILARDLRLASRRPAEALLPVVFFVVAASLFPLGVGPEAATLKQIAPGIVWVCALLSSMLSLSSMYAGDYADGSLEQMLLSRSSGYALAAAKCIAHWLMTGVPLLLVSPLLGLLFGLGGDAIGLLALGLLLGTPILSMLGGMGAALTLGLRNAAVPDVTLGSINTCMVSVMQWVPTQSSTVYLPGITQGDSTSGGVSPAMAAMENPVCGCSDE